MKIQELIDCIIVYSDCYDQRSRPHLQLKTLINALIEFADNSWLAVAVILAAAVHLYYTLHDVS